MKKILKILMVCLLSCSLFACTTKNEDFVPEVIENTDMSEYDGLEASQTLFKEISAKTLIEMINNKYSGIILFSAPSCHNCQNTLKYMKQAANNLGVETIYYLNFDSENYTMSDEQYNVIVNKLKSILETDGSGNPGIYTPHLFTLVNGKPNKTKIGADIDESPTQEEIDNVVKTYEEIMKDFAN